MTEPLSTEEMLECLNGRAFAHRADANVWAGVAGESETESDVVRWRKREAYYNRQAEIMETMAAILEVLTHPWFHHTDSWDGRSGESGAFVFLHVPPVNGQGAIISCEGPTTIAAFVNAHKAIKEQETAKGGAADA